MWQSDGGCFGWHTVYNGLPGLYCNSTCISPVHGGMWLYWQLGEVVLCVVVLWYLYIVVSCCMRFIYVNMWLYPNCVESVSS
jgi:hypothetical protein